MPPQKVRGGKAVIDRTYLNTERERRMTKPMTPRVLRINLLETRVRPTLADIDAWRLASGKQVHVRGLRHGPYARLYLSLDHEPFPGDLIDLLLPSIRERQGSIASVGAWIIQLEVTPLLDEQALWHQCEVA